MREAEARGSPEGIFSGGTGREGGCGRGTERAGPAERGQSGGRAAPGAMRAAPQHGAPSRDGSGRSPASF